MRALCNPSTMQNDLKNLYMCRGQSWMFLESKKERSDWNST